jgi:hypothetical protein
MKNHLLNYQELILLNRIGLNSIINGIIVHLIYQLPEI